MPMEIITDETELAQAGFYWREKDNTLALSCAPLEELGFSNAFSTRLGGVSPMPEAALNLAGFNDDAAENIYENRRRFLNLFEGEWSLASCWQMHGTDVRTVKSVEDTRQPEKALGETIYCDALTTATPRILVGVKTADCVPILLADSRTGACAAVHAGWRGTVSSIVARTLESMNAEYGSEPADVRAAIDAQAGRGPRADMALLAFPKGPNDFIGFAGNVPAGTLAGVETGLPNVDRAVASIQGFYGSVASTAAGAQFMATLRAATAADAKQLYDTADALRQIAPGLVSMAGEKGKFAQSAINSLKVTTKGNEVQLRLEVPQGDISSLLRALIK